MKNAFFASILMGTIISGGCMFRDKIYAEALAVGDPDVTTPIVIDSVIQEHIPLGASRESVKKILSARQFSISEAPLLNTKNDECIECDPLFITGRKVVNRNLFLLPEHSLVVSIGFKEGKSFSIKGWLVRDEY